MRKALAFLWGLGPTGQPSLAFIRFSILILLPSAVTFSAVVALVAPTSLSVAAPIAFLGATLLSAARAMIALLKKPTDADVYSIHLQYKVWFIALGFLAILSFFTLVLILLLFSPSLSLLVSSVEIGLLSVTIAFLALFTRYTATSFTADVTQLQGEFRDSNRILSESFVNGTRMITEAYTKSVGEMMAKLDQNSREQVTLLQKTVNELQELNKTQDKQAKLIEEDKRQREEAERVRNDEERRKQLAEQVARDQERQRMIPFLAIRLAVAGLIFHHVYVDVVNEGMDGTALEATLSTPDGWRDVRLGGNLSSQESRRLDFGDVSKFPNKASFTVVCVVADRVGRKYGFRAQFEYLRTTGWFNSTVSWTIQPDGYMYPEPSLL